MSRLLPPATLASGFLAACRLGDASLAGACLEAGADVDTADARGRGALALAAGRGHIRVVALLLARGAAARFVHGEAAEGLMGAGGAGGVIGSGGVGSGGIGGGGGFPLHAAVSSGRLRVAWALLAAGFSPMDYDALGNTALHAAAMCTASGGARGGGRRRQLALLRAVMAAGCDPEARNLLGQRAVDLLPRDAAEARCLLGLAAAATRCPATGAPFGAEELRYLCHSSGIFFSEEASAEVMVRARVPEGEEEASPAGEGETSAMRMGGGGGSGGGGGGASRLLLVPARMGADLVYAVADAEAALEAALNPFAAATAATAALRDSVGEGEGLASSMSPTHRYGCL